MSYDLKRSPLFDEIKTILDAKRPFSKGFICIVHTKNDDLESPKVISRDIIRDYAKTYTDRIYVKCVFPLGTFVKRIYQSREVLECTIISGAQDGVKSTRYRAIIPPENYQQLNFSNLEPMSEEDLNRSDIMTVTIQLVHRRIEPISLLKTRAVFTNVVRADLLINTILSTTASYEVDGKPLVDGVYMDEPDNISKTTQLVVPSNTPLLSLASHIQNNEGGLYNASIGNYIQEYKQEIIWFIYPLFNVHLYKQAEEKLIIIIIDGRYESSFDKTYVTKNNVTRIIVSRGAKDEEVTEDRPTNRNLGVRISQAESIINRPQNPNQEEVLSKANIVKQELLFSNKADGMNTIEDTFTSSISSNKHKMVSSIAYSAGERLDLIWQRSDHNLLYPGMSVEVYSEKNQYEIEVRKGKLLFNHNLYALSSGGKIQSNTYRSVSYLSVYVEKEVI